MDDDDVLVGKVTDKWRYFTKNQIRRARMFYDEAEKGVAELNAASGWPVSHPDLFANRNKPKPYHHKWLVVCPCKLIFFHFVPHVSPPSPTKERKVVRWYRGVMSRDDEHIGYPK